MTIHRTVRIPGQPGVGIRATTLAGTQHRTWSFAHWLESPRNDPANQPWRVFNPLFATQARREQPPAQVGIGLQLPGCAGAESGGWECAGKQEPADTVLVTDVAELTVTTSFGDLLAEFRQAPQQASSTLVSQILQGALALQECDDPESRAIRQEVVTLLSERFKLEKNPQKRIALMNHLVTIDPVAAVPVLAWCFVHDASWVVRERAALSLGNMECVEAEQALRAFRDAPWLANWAEDNRQRIAALQAEIEVKVPRLDPALKKALLDAREEYRVQRWVTTAIQNLADAVFSGVLRHENRRTARARQKILA